MEEGSSAGHRADLLVVPAAGFDDPADPLALATTRPLATLLDGEVVYREGIQLFVGAFSPVELELHEVIEAGDRVTARFAFRGHHGAEFLGVPPSHADVSVDGITMTRFEGGKVAEEWLCTDWYGLLQQIGAVPADFAGT